METDEDWGAFLGMMGKINKEELRLNFMRAKEYMTSYEIADTMLQVFDKKEVRLILDALSMHSRF